MAPTRMPPTTAATSPATALKIRLAKTAARKAPTRNWPSIAMLITPARSHMTPARAPRISGVAIATVPGNGLLMAAWNCPPWSRNSQIMKPT